MSGGRERDAARVAPAFWGLVVLVLLAGFGGGLFTGRGSLFGLFALVTLGALLAGASARGSTVLGGAAGALIAVPLAVVLLSGLGDDDDAGTLIAVGFSAAVALIYAAIGWYLAAPGRSRAELAVGIAAALALGVLVALAGIVGLFALACEGGC
ncbi:hypothetical protein HJD18_15070 [Thermoleophilia bacterium SCSIO 60948]|nr:hypothetical protein HJD18_15070 [Thermoleophilia bacterium SCSIO 60948]